MLYDLGENVHGSVRTICLSADCLGGEQHVPAEGSGSVREAIAPVGVHFDGWREFWRGCHSFETAMSAEGFGDLQPCLLFCSGTISSPHSVGGEITRGLTIGYAVGHGWRVRAEWFSADLGETLGYHDPATWLFLHTSVGSLGLSGTLPLGDILRIGAGPSLNVIDITRTDSPGGPPSHVTRLGITLHGGLTFPARSRVFVEAQVHRALVGTADVGPFTAQEIGGTTQVTLTRTRVSFSYTAIRVGLGLRIQ